MPLIFHQLLLLERRSLIKREIGTVVLFQSYPIKGPLARFFKAIVKD